MYTQMYSAFTKKEKKSKKIIFTVIENIVGQSKAI